MRAPSTGLTCGAVKSMIEHGDQAQCCEECHQVLSVNHRLRFFETHMLKDPKHIGVTYICCSVQRAVTQKTWLKPKTLKVKTGVATVTVGPAQWLDPSQAPLSSTSASTLEVITPTSIAPVPMPAKTDYCKI